MTAKEPTGGRVWCADGPERYQGKKVKLCKIMRSRRKSLATIAVIANCTRNDHSIHSVNTLLILDFAIFHLGATLGWRNDLSSGSFPQLDVSMPRPSRLSDGVLGKIPTDKEAQQDHTLKRLTHQGFPDGLSRTPLS